ncbi:hypothetical protein IQ274_08825 [Nostoc sp. LEGE 12447]|uniref:hypothetical protein n=1 Tax=Nostoc sp. LEGE 12447 TaxID=1828640 RepID=UPI0018836AD8|nr:hypothetical protein [Nostoc sp. LEGE 12447]MBE8998319.1 hypothetical protein [Nostoc sp. LEGE 12447]
MIALFVTQVIDFSTYWPIWVLGMGNGEWGMGNGEWGMGNGEWGMGNGALVIHSSPSFPSAPLFATLHR